MSKQISARVDDDLYLRFGTYILHERIKRKIRQEDIVGEAIREYLDKREAESKVEAKS